MFNDRLNVPLKDPLFRSDTFFFPTSPFLYGSFSAAEKRAVFPSLFSYFLHFYYTMVPYKAGTPSCESDRAFANVRAYFRLLSLYCCHNCMSLPILLFAYFLAFSKVRLKMLLYTIKSICTLMKRYKYKRAERFGVQL